MERYSQFEGPEKARKYYEEQVRQAYNEVCCYYATKKKITNRNEFEPLWNFVKQFAMAQLVNVDPSFINELDTQIDKMKRYQLVLYACQAYLTPTLDDYVAAIEAGDIPAEDVMVRYAELCTVLSWIRAQHIPQTRDLVEALARLESVCATMYAAVCSAKRQGDGQRNALQRVVSCCSDSQLPNVVRELKAAVS